MAGGRCTGSIDRTVRERCIWTNRWNDRVVPVEVQVPSATGGPGSGRTLYVLPEHEADLRAYNARVARYGRPMLVAILGLSALLLIVTAGGAVFGLSGRAMALSAGLGVAAMGALLVAFPFATPQTVDALGIRAARTTARVLGVLTLLLGLGIAAFA